MYLAVVFKKFPGAFLWLSTRGGSRIFSRGGADFQKIFENFDDLFF